jgi:hypothetical protein
MNTLLASLITTAALSAAFANAEAVSPASSDRPEAAQDLTAGIAPDAVANTRRIEGLWDEYVTVTNCANGAPLVTFRATNLFASGGALTAVNSNPPASNGPTLGTWWRVSHHGDFGAKMRFFRFNPDGSFAGVQQVTREIFVDPDGRTLTGTVISELFDVNDNLIATGCATEVGERVS